MERAHASQPTGWGDGPVDLFLGRPARSGLDAESQRELQLREWIDRAEVWAIERALRDTHGNRSAAARALGIGRRTLYSKLEKFGLDKRPDLVVELDEVEQRIAKLEQALALARRADRRGAAGMPGRSSERLPRHVAEGGREAATDGPAGSCCPLCGRR